MFIVFEGADACGKGTQIELLAEHFRHYRMPFRVVRHVGAQTIGGPLRKLLYESEERPTLRAEVLLFAADLAEIVEKEIKPAISSGQHVLCDRYWYSSVAYQGYGDGANLEWVEQVSREACGGLEPDYVLYFRTNPDLIRKRLEDAGGPTDHFERDLELQRRVLYGYRQLAREHRFLTFPSQLHPHALGKRVAEKVHRACAREFRCA